MRCSYYYDYRVRWRDYGLLPLGERNGADRWWSEEAKLARRGMDSDGTGVGESESGEAGPSLIRKATCELTEGTRKLLEYWLFLCRCCGCCCCCWAPCLGQDGCGGLSRLLLLFLRDCCCFRLVRKLSECDMFCCCFCCCSSCLFRLRYARYLLSTRRLLLRHRWAMYLTIWR